MRFARIVSASVIVGIGLSILAGCASAPPAPPPRPMTKEAIDRAWDQNIERAVYSAAIAGRDPATVRLQLYYNRCLYEAQHLADAAQRPAALTQCQVSYPQPAVAPTVRSNCYTYGGVTQCASQ
jgi:hypothetical protein